MVIYGGALHAFHYPIIRTDQILLPGVGYHPRHAQRQAVADKLAPAQGIAPRG
jgi:hypothetical protein